MTSGCLNPEKHLYLEYEIQQNKPGLLGAVTTLLGMLEINILSVSSIGEFSRGFLLEVPSEDKLKALNDVVSHIDSIKVTAFRFPTLLDRIAIRHGRRLDIVEINPLTYRFLREEFGVLVDFLGDTLAQGGNQVIGIRGMPHVGKTEAAIAACVYANKKWTLISSTILRQTLRTKLMLDEVKESIFLIDGITSTSRGNDEHWELLSKILALPTPKIIEHPDVILRDGRFPIKFDFMIEIRNHSEDEIRIEDVTTSFSSFDVS